MRIISIMMLLLGSTVINAETFSDFSQQMTFPSGTSIGPDGAVIYDSAFFKLTSSSSGHVLQNKKDPSQKLLTSESNGAVDHIVTSGNGYMNVVRIGGGGVYSATHCNNNLQFNPFGTKTECVTTNAKMCKALAHALGAKTAKEASDRAKGCEMLTHLSDDPDYKKALQPTLDDEKANIAKAKEMLPNDGSIFNSVTQNDAGMRNGNRDIIHLVKMTDYCANAEFVEDTKPSLSPNFKPASATR